MQEASATEISERAGAIAADAQADLDKALPALAAAVQCLKELKKAHIDEVKALKKPPGGVRLTLEVACVFFEARRAASASPSLMATSHTNKARAPDHRRDAGATVELEMPELAEKKSELVVQSAAMNKQLFDIESSILKLLAESKGNILDDTNLIETLAQAKKTRVRGVPRCCGAFTPSTRVVAIRRGRGWFLCRV